MAININYDQNVSMDQHMANSSLEQLNRSMNNHQMTAFSHNASYQ